MHTYTYAYAEKLRSGRVFNAGRSRIFISNAAIITEQGIRGSPLRSRARSSIRFPRERLRFYPHSDRRRAMRYRDDDVPPPSSSSPPPVLAASPRPRGIAGKRGTGRNAHFVKRLRPHPRGSCVLNGSLDPPGRTESPRGKGKNRFASRPATKCRLSPADLGARIPIPCHPRCIPEPSSAPTSRRTVLSSIP